MHLPTYSHQKSARKKIAGVTPFSKKEKRLTSRKRLIPTPIIRKELLHPRQRPRHILNPSLIPRRPPQILQPRANLKHARQRRNGNGSTSTPVWSHSPILISFHRPIELELIRLRKDGWITECRCLKYREKTSAFRVTMRAPGNWERRAYNVAQNHFTLS